jgi:hypothetical protein
MINKLIGLFKPKGLNRNYLQNKPFSINIKKQLDNQKKFSTDLKSKKFRQNTKIKEYTKRFI